MADLNEVLNELYRRDTNPKQTKQLTGMFNNFVDSFCQTMKEVDPLFNLLHRGSYYDSLRIGEATKFDLNIILRFPFQEDITFDTSSMPGYVYVGLFRPVDELIPVSDQNYATYKKIDSFIDHDKKFMPEKVRSWFESVCTKAVYRVRFNLAHAGYNIRSLRLPRSRPNLNLEIQPQEHNLPMISFNLVPVIQSPDFSGAVMYCVPKPHQINALLWRCSYPDKEREILEDGGCAKMVIKLLKKMRDWQKWPESPWHRLENYYLKTIVMLCKGDDVWPQDEIGYYFITSLERLSFCLDQREIPFFHNHDCNLLENINAATLENINGRLKGIIQCFRITENPAELKKYFISYLPPENRVAIVLLLLLSAFLILAPAAGSLISRLGHR
eukprot:gene176-789_t